MRARKVLIVTGDGGESYEALYAQHRFREARYEPVIAAPSRRRLHLVMHDFEPSWDTYVERQGYGLDADIPFDDVKIGEYGAILVLGGRAPEFTQAGKWVFSICHGIQILTAAGLVSGRRVTCYEHVRLDVEQCGGTFKAEQRFAMAGWLQPRPGNPIRSSIARCLRAWQRTRAPHHPEADQPDLTESDQS